MNTSIAQDFALGTTVRLISPEVPALHQGRVGIIENFDAQSGLYRLRDVKLNLPIGEFPVRYLVADEGPVSAEEVWAVVTGILIGIQDKHGRGDGMNKDALAVRVRETLIHRNTTADFIRWSIGCMSEGRLPGDTQVPASQQVSFYRDDRWGNCVRRVSTTD